MEPLRDSWGREIKSLRVSVTDKCNFRCRYCMPAEGLEWLPRDELLSFEEIARLVCVLAAMGVEEVRLTGGEPLVRRDLPVLVEQLGAIPGVNDLSLTTNGVLLDRLAGPLVEAGLTRLNVSLDSLSHVRFAEITRRDALDRVLAGLEEAERYPQLNPIKVNCVAVRGFTEQEVPALAQLARRKLYVVRFIEFMPLDADQAWKGDDVLTGGEIRALIEEHWPLEEIPAKPSSTAKRYRFADGAGEIGFVNPVSEPFCSSCDRIRLTADGQLRTCLFSRREWDLKTPLRDVSSDAELERLLRFAVRHKELQHKINDAGFVRASRSMSQIGGGALREEALLRGRYNLAFPMSTLVSAGRRVLPRGWADFGRQLAIWFGFLGLYQVARGIADRNPPKAFDNGLHVIGIERHFHGLFELSLQRAIDGSR